MTKVPTFGRLIADNRRAELDRLYQKTFKHSLLFLCLVGATAITVLYFLNYKEFQLAQRFINPSVFIFLVLTGVGNHIIACQATYVRSHKVEKYLGNAIVTAVLMSGLLFLATQFTEYYMVYFYFAAMWLFCLPHSIFIYNNFKRIQRVKLYAFVYLHSNY